MSNREQLELQLSKSVTVFELDKTRNLGYHINLLVVNIEDFFPGQRKSSVSPRDFTSMVRSNQGSISRPSGSLVSKDVCYVCSILRTTLVNLDQQRIVAFADQKLCIDIFHLLFLHFLQIQQSYQSRRKVHKSKPQNCWKSITVSKQKLDFLKIQN